MRWFGGSTTLTPPPLNGRARNRIWDLLAAHDIPYWLTQGQWIDRFGVSEPGRPSSNYHRCNADAARPLVDGLAWPLGFAYGPADNLAALPDSLTSSYQKHDDAYQNLADMRSRMEALLGPGAEMSPSNHIGVSWKAGPAYISIHIHPPELNAPYMDGEPYASTPALRTQCHLTICPAWTPDPAPDSDIPFEAYRAFLEFEDDEHPLPGKDAIWLRWPPDVPAPVRGFGALESSHIAIVGYGRQAQVIPVSQVVAIEMIALHQARCGASCELKLRIKAAPDARTYQTSLTPIYHGLHDHWEALGRQVARQIDVPFTRLDAPSE